MNPEYRKKIIEKVVNLLDASPSLSYDTEVEILHELTINPGAHHSVIDMIKIAYTLGRAPERVAT